MKHLVLGSSGQIGGHIVNYFKNKGEEIIEFDIEKHVAALLRKFCPKINPSQFRQQHKIYLRLAGVPHGLALPNNSPLHT